MKKLILASLILLLVLVSCAPEHTAVLNSDDTLTFDGTKYYPLKNSDSFSHIERATKVGAVLGGDVFFIEGSVTCLFKDGENHDTYYVPEACKDIEKLPEECEEFFYLPEAETGNKKYIASARRITGSDAEDFSFYLFYGRTPEESGLIGGKYVGEICALFPELPSLCLSYPVREYSPSAYSVEVDGTEYLLEVKWAREVGIIQ